MINTDKKPVVPVVFGTDENYVPYCGVAIQSLLDCRSSQMQYDIIVLYDALSVYARSSLQSLEQDDATIRFICIHEQIKNLRALEYNHLTVASAYRLVIPEVLPEYEKVLYLDSDIVICDDVAKLYGIDIGDCALGAAHGYFKHMETDFMFYHITRNLKIGTEDFFNAGILIMNLEAFRRKQITEKCFKLLGERDDLYFMDQCALNIVCRGKVFFIPQRWNEEWERWMDESTIDEAQIARGNDAAIIHYAGLWKAWDYPGRFLADRFWSVARRTVFYEQILVAAQLYRQNEAMELLCISDKLKNVAVYGAGGIGRHYVRNVLQQHLFRIAIWVDKNYQNIEDTELPVESVEKLYDTDFDHVVITVQNPVTAGEIKEMLIKDGVPEYKILQYKVR